MATIQYLPLAEPIRFTPDLAPAQPFLLLDPPLRRTRLLLDTSAPAPVIASPYDFPLQGPPPLPIQARRIVQDTHTPEWGRADAVVVPTHFGGYAELPFRARRPTLDTSAPPPPIALPYDLPLTAPPDLVRARRLPPATQSTEYGRADVASVPTFFEAFSDLPRRRPLLPLSTRTPEFGQTDVPPVPAPDLIGASMPDVTRRIRMKMGVVEAYLELPPGYPPEWFPLPQTSRAKPRLTGEAFSAPVLRPTVPFDPAQGTADLPQPQMAPRRRESIALKGGVPTGPPSAALTPPGVVSGNPFIVVPTRPAMRQGPSGSVANFVPIIPTPAPNGSWYPTREMVLLRKRPVVFDSGFAQNLPPISTPAYLSTFWNTYQPNEPIRWRGLLPGLQQAYASVPPETIIVMSFAAWKPVFPDWLAKLKRLAEYPVGGNLQLLSTIASGIGCIMLADAGVTTSTLTAADTTQSTLFEPALTASTLIQPEIC